MWCSNCRQDVPGVATSAENGLPAGGPLCCIRCGSVMLPGSESRQPADDGSLNLAGLPNDEADVLAEPDPFSEFDAWGLEEQLRHVKRLAAGSNETQRRSSSLEGLRIDAASRQLHGEPVSAPGSSQAGTWGSFFSWSGIAIGLAASSCGAVLTVWSFVVAGRHDLRDIGLPTLFGGLLLLVAGLLLQVRVAWRSSQSALSARADALSARADIAEGRSYSAADNPSIRLRVDATQPERF